MKRLLATVMAVVTLAAAGAAAAQDYRHGRDRDDWRGRGRGADVITIRDHGRVYNFDENDRMFYRLLESPFGMRPGNVYVYTDECRRDQCQVIIYSRYRRESQGRLWAPPIGRWRYDNRYDDRDYRRGRDRDYDRNWD